MRRRPIPSEPDQWMRLAMRYLAQWDRTAAQIEHFLREKGASPTQVKQTIGRLSALRYLNDRAYAQRWIEGRLIRKPMGRARLKAELLAKGIEDSLADGTIREALREVDEEALARRTLNAHQRKGRRLSPGQAVRLLRQRGFGDETIDRMIRLGNDNEGMDA